MSNLKSRNSSSDEFWSVIERTFGEVDKFIKLVLQVNGFNSFLALKGMRYEDKQEFFQSLELTVIEIVHSEYESQEKLELEAELALQHLSAENFRLRAGHRNFIMNLMLEVERTDVNEFFGRCYGEETFEIEEKSPSLNETLTEIELPDTSARLIVRRQESKQFELNQVDHGYSRDDQEYILEEEEEYLTEDTMDSMGLIKVEYESADQELPMAKKRKTTSKSTPSSTRRRPDHMYNDEFLAKSTNPRKRRLTLNKMYPNTDEGTRERFVDLIQQSMECILPTELLPNVENTPIQVEKDKENSWAVYCPLCAARLRLPVVKENDGKYFNYKRSNFERHLRFKHCKTNKAVFDSVEMIEEVIN